MILAFLWCELKDFAFITKNQTSKCFSSSVACFRIPGNGENAGEATKGGDVSSATTRSSTNDVETIMSQMHDLSFMLANNLSIPPK